VTDAGASVLPQATVTFLFSDVQGSTELLQRLGGDYAAELEGHRAIVRDAVEAGGGEVVDQRGEEAFAVFPEAADAVQAALVIQRRQADRLMRVRIGLHTGEASVTAGGYLGLDLHRAARICAAGHGGHVLVSAATHALVPSVPARDLGEYTLKGIPAPESIYALDAPGLARIAVPLRATPAATKRRWQRAGRAASRPQGLSELAWELRASLATTPQAERHSVSALAAAISSAARADSTARDYLARSDRRLLERRRASYRQMSVSSHRSAAELAKVERQLASLDALGSHREELARAARRQPASENDIKAATQLLEQTLEQARPLLGEDAEPLRRTLARGVYRSPSGEYIVLAYDTIGIEQRVHFDTLTEARAFRRSVRFGEKHQHDHPGPLGDYRSGHFGSGPG
jgi:class 3 adenylate cyclase